MAGKPDFDDPFPLTKPIRHQGELRRYEDYWSIDCDCGWRTGYNTGQCVYMAWAQHQGWFTGLLLYNQVVKFNGD